MEKIVRQLQEKIYALLEEKDHLLVAIDGSCTSGKTTLAAALAARFDCNVFHMDDFFLRPEQRTPVRLSQPGGNVDHERFRQEVLQPLTRGDVFSFRPYDCSSGSLCQPVAVMPKRVNIVEGSYSQHPCFGDVYDLRVFMKVAPSVRQQRILCRPAFLQRRFFEEWIPMEQAYFEAFGIEERADLVACPADNQ